VETLKQRLATVFGLIFIHSLSWANPAQFWPFYGNADEALTINATLTSDRFNNPDYAYNFNGISDYIEYADAPSLDLVGEMSIETWVYLDSTASNTNHTLLVKTESTSNIEVPNTYSLGTSGDSTYRFCVGGQEILFGDVIFNEWTHLAVTFSHEMSRAKCYVNNELVLNRPALLFDIQPSDYPLLVGADADHDKDWHGIIDDIRLFDRMVSETEIDSLYNLPFGINFVSVPSTSINFQYVYVGYPETTFVEIRNYGLGNDSLEIDSVSFSHFMFETDFSPVSLGSGESSIFNVIAAPNDNFRFTESMTIVSNDTSQSPFNMILSGQSLNPPNMILTPSSIIETLYTGGSVNYDFTVDNTTGDGVLGWTSKVVDGDSSTTIFFERPNWADWTDPVSQDRITPRVWLTRDNIGGLFNAFWESAADPPFTPHRIKWARGGLPQSTQNFAGGAIINTDPATFMGELLSVYCYDDNIFAEVTFETWSETGGGFSYTRTFLAPEWLKYETMDDTEWTHGSYSEELTIDATSMRGGEYAINIRIDSNSPAANEVFVPISLTVIEAPDYEAEIADFDFSQGFIGYPDTIEAEIFNKGYGDLIISGISLPGTDISVTPSDARIPEDTSQVFTFVFNPQSLGDQSGDIVFSTNDPDEISIEIPTQATGLEAPVIHASVSEMGLSIEEDEIVEHTFTITNPGQSDLQVELYTINYIEDSPANHYNFDHYEQGTFWGPTYSDPVEQEVLLDLESLTVGLRGDEVLFKLEAYESLHYRTTEISFDADMNQRTGFEKGPQFGWQLGTEYGIELSGNSIGFTDHDTWEPINLELSTFEFEDFSKLMVIGVPKTLFGPTKGWNSGVLGSWFWYPDALPSDGTPYIHVPHIADWVFTQQTGVTISPGDSSLITLSINTNDLPLGSNQALLHIISNDPEMRDLIIPINIDVLVGVDGQLELPTEFALKQNYPNPFNPSTTIEYDLPKTTDLVIAVYDLLSRKVWTYEASAKPAGYYSLQWDGSNQDGHQVASGVYLISLSTPEFRAVQKAVLIR